MENNKINIYFGAPLFTESERNFNKELVNEIREKYGDRVSVYLPQENDALNDKTGYADSQTIYKGDNDYLDKSDILIAVLDGVALDAGLATEVGRFAHIAENSGSKYILGLYTDVRQGNTTGEKVYALDKVAESVFSYVNLYTVGAIKSNGFISTSSKDLLYELKYFLMKVEQGSEKVSNELEELQSYTEGWEF